MNSQSSHSTPWNRGDGWFARIGLVASWIGWVGAFLGVYIAAIGYAGWVIGLALGWMPALLAALAASAVLRHSWWRIAIAAAIVGAMVALGILGVH